MPSLSRLFRSKSTLKPGSDLRGLRINVGPEEPNNRPTQGQVARLRQQVQAAQDALNQLDALVTALESHADAPPSDTVNGAANPPSSTILSVASHLDGMKRSTETLTTLLRRHAPPPPQTLVSVPAASSPTSALHPAPLRLPLRSPPPPTARAVAQRRTHPRPDASSPFREEMSFLDRQLRQRHSLNSDMPCPTATVVNSRSVSLPPLARTATGTDHGSSPAHSLHFSTEAKTRSLRSIHRPVPLLDDDRPLGMEELMAFLREGNSMRDL